MDQGKQKGNTCLKENNGNALGKQNAFFLLYTKTKNKINRLTASLSHLCL